MLTTIPTLTMTSYLSMRNLNADPLLLLNIGNCKIQTGTLKIIHPINLTDIQESIDYLTSSFYDKVDTRNPLGDIVKLKVKKLYNNFLQIKPPQHHRTRRWDMLGSSWKWIAGSPDAQDLRIINSTLNELITQNNQQFELNNHINQRISQLTGTINKIINNMKTNELITNEITSIITIINIDIVNKLLEDIQDAIILSKTSISTNKILSIQEISFIKSLLQNQGVKVNLPDEALQHVIPKFAVSQETLLYILHVPRLDNKTSSVIQLYPLVHKDQIIYNYPEYIIKTGDTLYATNNPSQFVQKASYLKAVNDACIYPLIFGKESECNSTYSNRTTQQLITEGTLLIQNARNNQIQSNCGPDDRTLVGNLLVTFSNCTINFNNQSFQNDEIVREIEVIHGALHNIKTTWNKHHYLDISTIGNETSKNRKKLEHVYLQQHNLNLKFWTLFGGFSFTSITTLFIVFMIFKIYCQNRLNGSGRSSLKGGLVTEVTTTNANPQEQHLFHRLEAVQQQQQQIAASLASLESGNANGLATAQRTHI